MKLLTEAAVRAALGRFDGNVAWAAATLGVTRGELWDFIQQRPRFMALLADWREEMVDEAESYLREASALGKSWAITFILRSLGRKAGIANKQPGSVDGLETPPVGAPDFSHMNTEQIVSLLQAIADARGSEEGTTTTEPEFMQRLDHAGEPGDVGDLSAPAGAGVRKALAKYGNVSRAAEKLGVTRAELMEYLTRRPELQDAANDLREEIVDHAESELRSAVRDKKPWAIRFVLKTLGASRGYRDDSRSELKNSRSELRVPSSELNSPVDDRHSELPAPSSELKSPVDDRRSELRVPRSELKTPVEVKTTEGGARHVGTAPASDVAIDLRASHPALPPPSRGQVKMGNDLPPPSPSEGKTGDAAQPSRSRPETESSQVLSTRSRGEVPRSAKLPPPHRDQANTSDTLQSPGDFETNAVVASNLVEEGRASGRALLESVQAIAAQRLSRVTQT